MIPPAAYRNPAMRMPSIVSFALLATVLLADLPAQRGRRGQRPPQQPEQAAPAPEAKKEESKKPKAYSPWSAPTSTSAPASA